MSTYEKQAKDFCEKYHVEFKAEFLANMPYFEDDKEKRDVYTITLKRGARKYSFRFGQSLDRSNKKEQLEKANRTLTGNKRIITLQNIVKKCVAPNEYDVLACITKYDPCDFENFCAEYGYDTDSRKAEKTYFAVQKEYKEVFRLFSDCMEELAEIQ